MLQQYLQAEVVNPKTATDVLIFLDSRLRELIQEALQSLGGKLEIEDEDRPLTKGDDTIHAIETDDYEGVVIWFMKDNSNSLRRRPLASDRWYTEDLHTLLEVLTTTNEKYTNATEDPANGA